MPEIIGREEARRRGLKRYYTGISCKHGHIAERLVSSFGCMACARIKSRNWGQNNPDIRRERFRKWAEKNSARMREHKRKGYWKDPEKSRAKGRAWAANNPQLVRDNVKAWRKANPEKKRQKDRAWNAKNQERLREYRRRSEDKHKEKNKERHRVKARRYYWEHREEVLMKKHLRRTTTPNEHERNYNRKRYYEGPQTPTGERQWLKKNRAQLRALKRTLRAKASRSQSAASTQAPNSPA